MPFRRQLSKQALAYLHTEAVKPGWWRDVLAARYQSRDGKERRLLIALRDGYLNAYADGQSILMIRLPSSGATARPRCRIARAFVPEAEAGTGHLIFDGERVGDLPYQGAETPRSWIKTALRHPSVSLEKVGVSAIAAWYPNVIDVEVALPGLPGGTPRMDFVCLERAADGVRLAFHEAKLFSNTELRANNLCPKVLEQLRMYEDALSDPTLRKQVIEAYRNTCVTLRAIAGMRGAAVGSLVHEVAKNPLLHLDLDPKPRLVVFGYGQKQAEDKHWPRHERALRDSGYKLLLGDKAEDAFVRDAATIEQDERADLAGLARFVSVFTAPGFQFGAWNHPEPDASGILGFPYCSLSKEGEAFVQEAYGSGWVKGSPFQWSAWKGTQEGRELMENHNRITTATPDQLAKLLTVYIRGDRFNEGLLLSGFESGLLTAVASWAKSLLHPPLPQGPAGSATC